MALNKVFSREVKKGSAELLILALLEDQPRHGYEIGKLIETRSNGSIRFQIASLYPTLYRLEKRKLIEGRWVEKPGERRRRFYRLTAEGRQVLKRQRSFWNEFIEALDSVAKIRHA
jgi:PadR family transcriptional regulator, regulatory protein PadR